MEEFSAIPVFVAVVEKGGFSAAARALGVSKSAVSKRVTQLEQQLGVRLLYRTTRKLSLTEAGERYFEHAARALQAAEQAEDAVAELQGDPQGTLKISTPMSFGRLHVAPLIPKLLKRYPKLQVELVMDDRKADLIDAGFDIAIRSGRLPDSTLIARKLAPLRQVLCASPEYIAEYGLPSTPAALADHNCVLFSYSSDSNNWTLCAKGESTPEVVQVTGNYRVNNSEALVEALRAGIGIGRLPTFVAGPDLKAGRLVQLFDNYQIPSQTFYAVFPERRYMPAKVRAFLDFAIENFGGDEPYWDQP